MHAMDPQSTLERPALEERIALLRPGLDLLGLPACVLDARLRYCFVNVAYCEHTGRKEADFPGRTPDEVFEVKPPDRAGRTCSERFPARRWS
jgi:PAS domain-containing protein